MEKQKYKNLKLPIELHSEIKQRASKVNLSMIKYMELVMAETKSQAGINVKEVEK